MSGKEQELLHERLMILKDYLEKGKLKVTSPLADGFRESLMKVKYGPDGLVDPQSVDARIRSTALFVSQMETERKYKEEVSLKEIQSLYIDLIYNNFGELYQQMIERKHTPHSVATALSRKEETSSELVKSLEQFLGVLNEFWDAMAFPAYLHLRDLNCLKSVFGGDFFPSHSTNIASVYGFYIDTIILPDPFIRSLPLFEKAWNKKNKAYYLVKHALNILQYRDLILADVPIPIVAILPDMNIINEYYYDSIQKRSELDTSKHLGQVFGRNFESLEDFLDFASSINNLDKLSELIVNKERLLFDSEWKGGFKDQFNKYCEKNKAIFNKQSEFGDTLINLTFGRMMQSNDLLSRSLNLRGVPVIDAPTSWEYFAWKLEYDSKSVYQLEEKKQLHVVRAIGDSLERKLTWIGKIPPEGLIEIRRNNALEELRDFMTNGIEEIITEDEDNFIETTERVINNIENQFMDYKNKLEKIRQDRLGLFRKDLGSCLIYGSISIAAAVLAHPVLGVSAALGGMFGIPSVKDIYHKSKELNMQERDLIRSPVGLYFKYIQ